MEGNLIELPFPDISATQNSTFSFYVDKVLNGEESYVLKIQEEIYRIFGITEEQIIHIKEKLNGTLN